MPRPTTAFYSESYVEALAAGHAGENDLYEPVRFDPSDQAGQL
jgi:hypothetical protein